MTLSAACFRTVGNCLKLLELSRYVETLITLRELGPSNHPIIPQFLQNGRTATSAAPRCTVITIAGWPESRFLRESATDGIG
jgi:hypothetical protein